jgi:DNA topoisomerase II
MAPKKVVKKADAAGCKPKDNIAEKYKKLDQKEHVLTRPGMYIGSIDTDVYDTWVFDEETKRMSKRSVKYIPGLFKIFDEILVNAIDHAVRLASKPAGSVHSFMKTIKVKIDKESGVIEVFNDGDGIEIVKHPEHDIYIPELIFGNMLTSTNYDDTEEKIIGGQNGIGAKACNIFSKFFEIETIDPVRKLFYTQRFENNMSVACEPQISKSGARKPFTIIRFLPDYARFGLEGLTPDMYMMMQKRVFDACAVTDKDTIVYLNDVKLEFKTFEKYVDLYLGGKDDHARVYEAINDRWEVVASYNAFNGFEQVSFVNGIWTIRGGKHVEYILNQIVKKLTEMIQKKKKDAVIKPQIVKDNLILFVKCNIVNPSFDSQSKETLTTIASKFGSKAEVSDKFIEKLYKSGIVEKILEISEIQGAQSLKKTDGKKRSVIRGIHKLDDANWAGTAKSKECTLILTEGDSAKTMALAGLSKVGRDRYGVFPLRGKLMNVKDVTVKKIMENEEINNLKKILGLESGKDYKTIDDLRYGKIMLLTDQDVDGSHIKGLIFNMFHTLWPSLVRKHNFLTSMMTPIVKASRGNLVMTFYNLSDYDDWRQATNEYRSWTIKYYKGLGTSKEDEALDYFTNMRCVDYAFRADTSDESLDLAFNKKRADERKQWLSMYDRKNVLNYKDTEVSYDDFVNKELIHFSNYDLERSIPSVCDGLKVSQRKILYACFKKNLVDGEIKVAQLAGYVSEKAAYHHGEASLQGAIVGMAQDFVGSNNINILLPNGQFGSRVQGGKDASQPRYIFTVLNDVALKTYMKVDNAVLTYLDDDGYPVEPQHYVPIIPMVLVNGAIGIGTGFSTNIPCYNPKSIIGVLKKMLKGEQDVEGQENETDLVPWYSGFTGRIEKNEAGKFVSRGIFSRTAPTKVEVTELPVGMWTEDFKIMLEEMLEASDKKEAHSVPIKHYENQSTHVLVHFSIHFNSVAALDEYMRLDNNGYTKFENEFKLVSSKNLGTTNMYLFNQMGQITKYDSALDIIREYYGMRLGYYGKRKDHLLAEKQRMIDVAENKIRFIREVIAGTIVVHKLKKAELEALLVEREYMKFDDSYDYIVKIPIYNLTIDKVEELEEECAKNRREYDAIFNKTLNMMWLEDLEDLEASYDKYIVIRTAKMRGDKAAAGASKKAVAKKKK